MFLLPLIQIVLKSVKKMRAFVLEKVQFIVCFLCKRCLQIYLNWRISFYPIFFLTESKYLHLVV